MRFEGKITNALGYLSGGFHAVPPHNSATPQKNFPSMHRLYNVLGMVIGFSVMKYMSDILFGHKINGSQYEEIRRQDVPRPLRFLHGAIKYNPFSDHPRDQWLKVLHQMLPAAGGAIGAVQGSSYFFKTSAMGPHIKALNEKVLKKEILSPLESDTLASYKQGLIWRNIAGGTAWLASVSGLTGLLYGTSLNSAFFLNNNAKTMVGAAEAFGLPFLRKFSNTQSKLAMGPEKAFNNILSRTSNFLNQAKGNTTVASENFGKEMANSVFSPLFRKLNDDEKKTIVTKIQNIFEEAYNTHKGKETAVIQKEISEGINTYLKSNNLQKLGGGMLTGNNGWLGRIAESMDFGKKIDAIRLKIPALNTAAEKAASSAAKSWGIAAGAAGVGLATAAMASTGATKIDKDNLSAISAEEYVKRLENQQSAKRSFVNGGLLGFAKWMGDAALAVVPVHRFWSAIGLSGGGFLGLKAGELLTGRRLSNDAEIAKTAYSKILQPLYGLLKYDPNNTSFANRMKKFGGLYTFAAFCFAGVAWGSHHAYKPAYKKNEKMESLEDSIARVRQIHGDKMILPVALSSIFGSAAGTFLLEFIPFINYGASLSYRTVSMQDRHVMTPGLKSISGGATNSYFSLREGTEYICKYAVHNPDKNPTEFEYLARTILEPLTKSSGMPLTGEHIAKFVEKIHEVRDKYWEEGGVPKEKQDALKKEMVEHFKGKGLDKTLYECGVDTLKIKFTEVGGLIGKFAKFCGAKKKIEKEQEAYHALVNGWRKDWNKEESAKEEPETNLKVVHNAINPPDAEKPARTFATEDKKKSIKPQEAKIVPFTDKVASNDSVMAQGA